MSAYDLTIADGATVDSLLTTVRDSNLSATHKITRSATLVVAASDSSAKSKAQADYICDGTADEVEINAALDEGKYVFLTDGHFINSSSGIIEPNSNNLLRGSGYGTIIMGYSNIDNPLISVANNATNVIIGDLCIEGLEKTRRGIYSYDMHSSMIYNVYFNACNLYGVSLNGIVGGGELANWQNNSLVNNKFTYNSVGINVGQRAEYNIINDNTFLGNVCGATVVGGNNTISNNIFQWCSTDAALKFQSGQNGHGSIVTGCQFKHNLGGILIESEYPDININTSSFEANINYGIKAINTFGTNISNNILGGGHTTADLWINGGNFINVNGNTFYGSASDTPYNILEDNGSHYNYINGNSFSGSSISPISSISSQSKIGKNYGYVTENVGTANITAGQTSVDVTHGLAAAPTRVQLTPTTATAGKDPRVTAKAASTFTITIDSAHSADISFDWQAVI